MAVCFTAAEGAELSSGIRNEAVFANGGDKRYKSIRLIPEIYNRANGDLSDLRIVDGKGENIPFFIYSGSIAKYKSDRKESRMRLINAYTKDDSFYFDYAVDPIPESTVLATFIETATADSGFAKNIEIYGSYDDVYWEFIQYDILYKIGGVSKLRVDFENPQKYTHYRFKLANNLEKISFSSVAVVYQNYVHEYTYFIESTAPAYTVREEEKRSVIVPEGLLNLKIAEIAIETDSMFKRQAADSYGHAKELYNLTFEDASYNDAVMPYYGQQIERPDFEISIYNGDDKPINVNGLKVKYYADELIFEDNGSAFYTVRFERDAGAKAPEYDIARYKNEIMKGGADRLEFKELRLGEPIKTPAAKGRVNYSMIFNIAILAVGALLGLLILTKLGKPETPEN